MVRIVQPVFDFLGTVPGYREYGDLRLVPGLLHRLFA
jgi:hypothetical protein